MKNLIVNLHQLTSKCVYRRSLSGMENLSVKSSQGVIYCSCANEYLATAIQF